MTPEDEMMLELLKQQGQQTPVSAVSTGGPASMPYGPSQYSGPPGNVNTSFNQGLPAAPSQASTVGVHTAPEALAGPERTRLIAALYKTDPKAAQQFLADQRTERTRNNFGLTSQMMQDPEFIQRHEDIRNRVAAVTPGVPVAQDIAEGDYAGAARDAALTAIPYGLGKLGKLTPYAFGAWGASNVMSPEALAEEKAKNPFTYDEEAYKKRKLEARKTANSMGPRAGDKYMTEFDKTENEARKEATKSAAQWESEQQGRTEGANALERFKNSVKASAGVFPKEKQDQIQNATTLEQATKTYNDASNEYNQGHKTTYEKYAPEIESAVLGTSALGGGIGYGIAAGRARSLRNAEQAASHAYDARYGSPTRGIAAPTTPEAISAADSELLKTKNALSGSAKLGQHPGLGAMAGAGLAPWFTGAFAPNMYDAMLNPHQDIKDQALGNIIPGYGKSDWQPGGRDWLGPLWTHARPFLEGAGSHATGASLAGYKDYQKLQNMAGNTVQTINERTKQEQEKMAKALKTPRAKAAPTAAPPTIPPPSPAAATGAGVTPAMFPDNWGKIGGVQDYKGRILQNMQNKMGTNLPISGVKKRKD